MVAIEAATPKDIPALAGLLNVLFAQEADFAPDREKQERGLEMILNSESVGRVFVARSEGEIVGMVSLLFTFSTAEGGPVCWLEDMVVLPNFRERGIGSRLLEAAVDFAQHNRFLRITLLTDRLNSKALSFYARHGFSESAMKALRRKL